MKRLIFLSILLISMIGSCAKHNTPDATPIPLDQSLVQQRDLYCGLYRETYDQLKWTHSRCDGMLFTHLYALGCPNIDVSVFEDKDTGQLFRDPDHTCFTDFVAGKDGSRSGMSRDMLIGRLWWIWVNQDLSAIERMINFGEQHDWDMCGGQYENYEIKQGRCIASASLKGTMYEIRYQLGGADHGTRYVPFAWNPWDDDFTAHLSVLHMSLRGFVFNGVTDLHLDFLQDMSDNSERNALFALMASLFGSEVDQNKLRIIDSMNDSRLFPKDRLPNESDRCTEYLWQRNNDENWQPCEDGEPVHSGTDFVIVIGLKEWAEKTLKIKLGLDE